MKKLSVLFLLCFLFLGCTYNPFEETTITIKNECSWVLYIEVSGGSYCESFTVGEDDVKITIPFNTEYNVRITSPYDYGVKTVSVTPKMFTSYWSIKWSTYTASYQIEQY